MRFLLISVIIVFNLIFQSTIVNYFSIWDVVPNTGLIILVSFASLSGKKTGAFLGLIIGLLQDVLFCDVIGVYGLIYFFIGYSVGMINQKLFKDSIIVPFLFTGLATISFHLFYYFFMYFLGIDVELSVVAKNVIIIELIYNSIISILIHKQISKIYKTPHLEFKVKKRR